MKKYLLCIVATVCAFVIHAQSRYLWTGAVNNNWKNAGNWTLVAGPAVSGNYPNGITSIALFGNSAYGTSTNVNCTIDGNYLPTGALYVGGIEVNGYTGTITQGVNNRLVISDCPGLNGCAYNPVYKAVFNFGTGGKFIGSTTVNVAGSLNYNDNYTMAVGVEMFITGGEFYSPRKLLMENNLTVTPGCFFGECIDASGGVVSFYPRPGSIPIPTYFLDANGCTFHDLQIYTGKVCDLVGGSVTVANNLITAGAGGYFKISNGQMHIKRDIIINSTDYSTYSLGVAHGPGGTAMLYLDGTVPQNIIKNPSGATETSGPLGNLTIDNSNGVTISERVNIAGSLTFVNGIIKPQTPGSSTDVLVLDNAAVVYGASDNSYCEGPVRKHTYSAPSVSFEFPVGKNGEYHPIFISAPTGGSGGYGSTNPANYTQFTAEYFDTPTPNPTSISATTYAVHNCQYWSLTRNNKPTSNAKVSLSWNSNTCQYPSYFASASDLRVAQYDGAVWQNLGVSGGVGSYTYGSKITEATGTPASQFLGASPTYFTFCHATPYAPLTLTTTWTEPACNPGNDGTATVNVSGAVGAISYSWSTTPVQTGSTATGLSMGTYTVTVTTSSGQSGTATVNINTSTYTGVTLTSGTVLCGTSLPVLLTLGSPAGGTYSGGPYVTNSGSNYYFDPQISGPGVFPITYTDGNGCGYTATENVTVDPGPERPYGWEWANGPSTTDVSRANDLVYYPDPLYPFVYVIGNFSGTVDFGGVTLTSAGGEDVYVACYLAVDGSLNWAKSYGGTSNDYGTGITRNGTNLGICGYFNGTATFGTFTATSYGDRDGFIVNMDLFGTPLNFVQVGTPFDDQANAITCDGTNYYVVGYNDYTSFGSTASFGSGITLTDVTAISYLAKYSMTLTCQWATNGSGDWTKANAVDVNSNGNITVGGYLIYSQHGFLETYTSAGAFLKFNYFEALATGSAENNGVMGGIGHDASGNIYITGAYSDPSLGGGTATFNTTGLTSSTFATISGGTVLTGSAKNEVYDAMYSSDLDLLNVVNIGANGGNFPHCDIEVDAAGNQYITGTFIGTISNLCYSIPSFGYDDIFVMKVDNMGVFQWAQKPDGPYFEYNPSIEMDPFGDLYLCGNIAAGPVTFGAFSVNAGATNAFQAKLTPTGTSVYRTAGEASMAAEENASLLVYPNPASGQFTINTSSSAAKDVFVYDATGRVVFSLLQTTETSIAVDISGEAKGLYVVKVVAGDEIQSERISNQ